MDTSQQIMTKNMGPGGNGVTMAARIAAGRTEPGVGWQQDPATPHQLVIFIDVDTSAAGFTSTPVYVASLCGDGDVNELTGPGGIYRPTPTGFRVYVRRMDQTVVTPDQAQQHGWCVQWIGVHTP